MSAAPTIAPISAAPNPLDSTTTRQPLGRQVMRSPEQLRLHPALEELGWKGAMNEFNAATRLKNHIVPEPVFITTTGTILAGFGRWRLALVEGRREIECIEYPLGEEESLQFILRHHQTRRGWNPFFRICLALTQEPFLQRRALDNMRAGGKYKGSANLPEARHIDVRQEIAFAAGVCARYVSNVKTIRTLAHPRLIDALRDGILTIHGAMRLCKLSQAEQLKQFIRKSEDREIDKIIRQSIAQPKKEQTIPDVSAVLEVLKQQEERKPGSVVVRVGRHAHTVIVVGEELLNEYSQADLELS